MKHWTVLEGLPTDVPPDVHAVANHLHDEYGTRYRFWSTGVIGRWAVATSDGQLFGLLTYSDCRTVRRACDCGCWRSADTYRDSAYLADGHTIDPRLTHRSDSWVAA